MKNALIFGTALMLAACSNAADTADAGTNPVIQVADAPIATETDHSNMGTPDMAEMETKTKAVLIYADWCGSCKILDPKVKAVQAMGTMPGLEYVTLNYTDKNPNDFYAQAAAAGVEDAVRAELDGTIKTGWLLLIDVDDARVVSKVTKEDDTSEIAAKLTAALAAS
jgi:thiol-disulfide isomerase/thioredoxin